MTISVGIGICFLFLGNDVEEPEDLSSLYLYNKDSACFCFSGKCFLIDPSD